MSDALAIGVDLGGTKLVAGLVDADGACLAQERWPRRIGGYDEALDAIAQLVGGLQRDAAADGGGVAALGVAVAAFLDTERAQVRHAANLDWRERPLRADLAARVGLPVTLANDADAAAWGEHVHGAGAGRPGLLLLTVGTGLGTGLVLDGRLVTGAHGLAPELGHAPVAPGGRDCPCGARGCLEPYASGTALRRAAQEAARADPAAARRLLAHAGGTVEAIDGPAVLAAAREGDAAALAAFAEVGHWLGIGVAHAVALLDPALVLIGGGLADAGKLLLAPARAACAAHVGMPGLRGAIAIEPARLGALAGVVGAAALSRRAPGRAAGTAG